MQSLMALSDSSRLFISNSLETHVVRTWCSSRAGLALCALSTPGCIVNLFFVCFLLSFQFICTIFLRALSLSVWPSITHLITHSVRFKIVIEIDYTSLKPTFVENSSSCINVQRYSQYNIYWDEVALVFLCFNYSQETLSNALSDYSKYTMGRNCLVL